MNLDDFYIEVLRELNLVPPNGKAAAEDLARVKARYPAVHASLLDMDLVEWGRDEDIPWKFSLPLIKVVAFYLASQFAVPMEHYLLLKSEGELDSNPISMGERQLRKRMAPDYVPSTIQNEFI